MAHSPLHLHEVAKTILVSEVYIRYQDEVLMFKRSEHKKKFPGFWSIPGGHIDEGEDPLTAAIREVQEETGITVTPSEIKLKVVALHHHLDRQELYLAFAFEVRLPEKPSVQANSDEGAAHWVNVAEMFTMENVFEPVRYYFDHVLNDHPGVMYNNSQWRNSQLVQVFSDTVDQNY